MIWYTELTQNVSKNKKKKIIETPLKVNLSNKLNYNIKISEIIAFSYSQ